MPISFNPLVKKGFDESGIADAPSDGSYYARKDAAWEVISLSGLNLDGGLPDSNYGGITAIDGGGI